MTPMPCPKDKDLEEAARHAEERKRQAIERLMAKLDPPKERFGWPMKGEA